MSNEFKDRLKFARKKANMTQAQLAKAINTTQGNISDLESGRNKSSTSTLQIASVLKVNPTWLALGDGNPDDGVMNEQNLSVQMNGNTVTNGSLLHQNVGNYGFYDDGTKNDDNWFVVADHALSPTFCKNDHVLIDRTRKPQAGDYVLAEHDGKQIFRKYRPPRFDDNGTEYEQLVVYNDDYPILDSRFHTFAVLGVAVEHKRRLV